MRRRTRSPFPAALLLAFTAACATAAGDGLQPGAQLDYGMVELTNDGRQDVVVYLVRDGARYRMGHVSRMQTAHFRIPRPGVRESYRVSLVAEPVGGGRPVASVQVLWRPGQDLRGRVGRMGATLPTFDISLH